MKRERHEAIVVRSSRGNPRSMAKCAAMLLIAFFLVCTAGGLAPAAAPAVESPPRAAFEKSTTTTALPFPVGSNLSPLKSVTDESKSTGSSSPATLKPPGDEARILPKAPFTEVLWERLRIPIFLFVLGLVFLVFLLFSLHSRRPTGWRSLTGRSLTLSIIIHVILLLSLDSVVLSQRVFQAVRESKLEIQLDADSLAQEKVSLQIREQTTELPLADSAIPAVSRQAEVRLPEAEPFEEKRTVAPGQIDLKAFELPADVTEPKLPEDKQPARMLAAQPTAGFRIPTPQVTLETPQLPTLPELSEKAKATVSPQITERPLAPAMAPDLTKATAKVTEGPPVARSAAPITSIIDFPSGPSPRGATPPETTLPPTGLALKPPPKFIPGPIILEERPASEEPYRLRKPEERAKVLESFGGSPETEESVRRALQWLAAHQSDDGRWAVKDFDAKCGQCGGQGEFNRQDVAATALATLAFLGAGHTHRSDGPYRHTVARAIAWLTAQARDNGDLRGQGNMYDQGMATIALAEACGMTRDASLSSIVERAVKFIASAQNVETGGWRYFPGEEGDTSVFGWQVMALKSASMAHVAIPEELLNRAERWLERVGGGKYGGLCGYQGKNPSPAMAAEGMFARQLLGYAPTGDAMIETANYLRLHLPDNSDPNMYYWYYGTLALFQHQGTAWEQWNRAMRKAMLSSQDSEGTRNGSWPPRGQWGKQGGRIVETAMATLCLEVYYRYLPLYTTSATAAISAKPAAGNQNLQKPKTLPARTPSGDKGSKSSGQK